MQATTRRVVAILTGIAAALVISGVAYASTTGVGQRLDPTALTPVAETRTDTTAPRGVPRVDWQDMWEFMQPYRTPDGAIDMNRMMQDVRTGEVESPCGGVTADGTDGDAGDTVRGRTVAPGYGGGMMGGNGYGGGMMGGWVN